MDECKREPLSQPVEAGQYAVEKEPVDFVYKKPEEYHVESK